MPSIHYFFIRPSEAVKKNSATYKHIDLFEFFQRETEVTVNKMKPFKLMSTKCIYPKCSMSWLPSVSEISQVQHLKDKKTQATWDIWNISRECNLLVFFILHRWHIWGFKRKYSFHVKVLKKNNLRSTSCDDWKLVKLIQNSLNTFTFKGLSFHKV